MLFRSRLPAVSIHRQFKILVEDHIDRLCDAGLRLVAHPGDAPSPTARVREHPGQRVLIAIGPEGGWNAFEMALLEAHGFRQFSLGPRTLRVDTACTALLAITHAALKESLAIDLP